MGNGFRKAFSCLFWKDIFCVYVKRLGDSGVLKRCMKCKHYFRFCREMEAEEDAFFEEVDRFERGGSRG